ncbi:MAG TPA: ABC transporter permease subunit [Candidatus Limnocylindrales bacterium]|nr:ABC transporter permease subunit [Candidatus Limnocylindrales bacterium]
MVNVILEIAKKEIKTFFRQSRAFVTVVLLLIFGYISVYEIQNVLQHSGYTSSALSAALGTFLFLVAVYPASITSGISFMAFAVERDQKTLEYLLSLPPSDNEIFLGKFLAAVIAGLSCLALAFSLVIGYTVFANAIVWNGPLFNGSLSLLAFVVAPMLVVTFALIASILSRYLSSRDSFVTNLVSMAVLLGIFALKETITLDAFTFNLLIGVVLAVAIVGMGIFGAKNFNREKLVARL